MDIALKYLDNGTMISITGSWIEQADFASVAEIKPLLPKVKTAHAGLLAAKPAASDGNSSATSLIDELRLLDVRHDHSLRASYYLLEAASEFALAQDPPDTEASAGFLETRRALFPEGLGGTRATYLTEEGNAKQAEDVVSQAGAHKQRLSNLRLSKSTSGLDLFETYTSLSAELGDLDRKKSAAVDAASDNATPATLAKARNAWIHIVGTVVRVLEHVEGDTAKTLLRGVTAPAEKAAKAVRDAKKAEKKSEEKK